MALRYYVNDDINGTTQMRAHETVVITMLFVDKVSLNV